MRVVIIAEGSKDIGFGHITRCTSLFDAFEEREITPQFIVNGDEGVLDLLEDKNYQIFNWLKDRDRLFDLVKGVDIAILDSYLADISFYKTLSDLSRIPVYIDDTKRLDYPKGVVVNGTVYADELNYPQKNESSYLLGSQYIPLRKEFWEVPEKLIRETIETVMVTFGGDDMRNLTPEVLKVLNSNFPAYKKKVVIGKGFKNIEQIKSLKDSKTELVYFPDAEGMKKVMLESDIAISAGGQTLYELARVGVPTVAIAVADNQKDNVIGCKRAGIIEFAGSVKDNDVSNNLIRCLNYLLDYPVRVRMKKISKFLVDGKGARRIIRVLNEFLK